MISSLRAARYGSWELAASSPDVTLAALRFRKGARFIYEYDLNIPWRHEVRIEDRLEPEARKTYPVCTGGDGACPPEDCGGPESFMDRRDDWLSFDALEDLDTMVEVFQEVVRKDASEKLALDQETRWRLEDAVERAKARERSPGSAVFAARRQCPPSRRRAPQPHAPAVVSRSARRCASRSAASSAASSPCCLPDAGDQRVGGGIGQLVEPALQRGGRRFGVETGRGDALVSEETLQVGDVHAEREQAGRHRVAQQMRVDALADPGGDGDGADDLADPLARQHVWRWPRTFLTAGEQRSRPPRANVQPKQLRQVTPDRHLPALSALALADRDHALGEADILDPSCTSSEAGRRFPARSAASARCGRPGRRPGRGSAIPPRPSADRRRRDVRAAHAGRRAAWRL